MNDTLLQWASIAGFVALGGGIVIWVVARLATRSKLAISAQLTQYRSQEAIELKLQNLRRDPADVRSAYLMFASGSGIVLRPVMEGSAPLPLTLPTQEDAYLRYPFIEAANQLSHHRNEQLKTVACLVNQDDLVQTPIPPELARTLMASAAEVAAMHLLDCDGCSSVTTSPRPR